VDQGLTEQEGVGGIIKNRQMVAYMLQNNITLILLSTDRDIFRACVDKQVDLSEGCWQMSYEVPF
jgi:hypothetical protein